MTTSTDTATSTTTTKRTGRPAKHASAAERQKAYRNRWKLISARVTPSTVDFIDELAETFDMTRAEVVAQMITFATTNRDWRRLGMTGFQVKPRIIDQQ